MASRNGGHLVRSLPPYYPKDDGTGLFDLLDSVGYLVDELEDDIAAVDRASTVQHADTVDQLRQHGELVDLRPREGESKESYRSRLLAEYQLNTCEGTADDIITIVSEILNVDPEQIEYAKSTEPGTITLTVPGKRVDDLAFSIEDLSEIVNELIAAGYRIDLTSDGSLKYTDEATYDTTSDWSTTPGYDGLDSNGDPTGDGGTYSGLL